MSRPADSYGRLVEPTTLVIQRVLPGSLDRVWAYLADSDLRAKWLASGTLPVTPDAPFDLVWRNDELTRPPGDRPADFPAEQRMTSRVIAIDPPRLLQIGWGSEGDVTFELTPAGERVLLTITHRRLAEHGMKLNVSAGWHVHLDVLEAELSGTSAAPFWDNWQGLKGEYDAMLPQDPNRSGSSA